MVASPAVPEIYEDELHSAIEARSESLQTLRELTAGMNEVTAGLRTPTDAATQERR